MTDDEERALRQEIMKMDRTLKGKQIIWETPRNIAILAASMATVFSVLGGVVGYKLGQMPQQPIVIQLQQPAVAK